MGIYEIRVAFTREEYGVAFIQLEAESIQDAKTRFESGDYEIHRWDEKCKDVGDVKFEPEIEFEVTEASTYPKLRAIIRESAVQK